MPAPVLLFHGLGRTGLSMLPMARALRRAGFEPHVVDYPSRKHAIGALVDDVVAPRVEAVLATADRVHFVTHSLGGVLVRAFAAGRADAGRPLPDGSRAVMLAPPHAGSEVADALGDRLPFRTTLGPALSELGTGDASVPAALGPVRGVEAGVIAGTRALVPFGRLFGGPHDGLVSVASAHAPDGLADRAVVPKTHALMMMSPLVIGLTIRFLETGRFAAPSGA
ncbi:esterase/lipase family protein [Rubrivirga sp.]|uniref:esterase/lipase family protein n=1 Tax=Rubrivirga sp. TaxID=1885344 RepID=UPI003B52E447